MGHKKAAPLTIYGTLGKFGVRYSGASRAWRRKRFTKKTVYVRLGIVVKKESWNSSTDKAKTLTIEDFGTPDEVKEMARPIREAHTRQEAEKALECIISGNGSEKRSSIQLRSKSGLTAFLRRSSIGKLVSGVQEKEKSKEALWQAVANIDKLYENAIEPWRFELNPAKNNDGLRDRRILFAPMDYEGQILPIKVTVKEFLDPQVGAKLYSIEAIDYDLIPKKEGAGTLTAINPE
ncbi:hypothetical protein FACS1894110_14880 [Spirochaetia bacterium]|nr:hypothetical protein FACS1894110_14880 [Spirochaetia bacterium]